jgi:predicted dithiol-disulfide oxidoreductase (DUF899 family)
VFGVATPLGLLMEPSVDWWNAPVEQRQRWCFKGGDVGYNYGTSPYASQDLPGVSVFHSDQTGHIFHTYSSYPRGGDSCGAYNWLDLTPKGRNETEIMDWVRLHDDYRESEPTH